MIASLFAVAFAAETETTVLVSTLQPRNPESVGLASLVENFLAQELARHPDIDVLRVEDTPPFEDYSARIYMEGCPVGEVVGCTQIVGERGKARMAVTGTVQQLVGGTKVTIDVLDIEKARTLVSFTSELEAGNDEAFAEGVAKVLVAAISGEIGQERDIRNLGGAEPTEPMDDEAVRRQLAELSRELGSVTTTLARNDRLIERPTYTMDDLARKMEGEGPKPWERLGMPPEEYLRYKNSGLSLYVWRQKAIGRQGQLLLRPFAGLASGPYSGTYYGRWAYDTATGSLDVVDAYAAQAVQTGSGGTVGASVAWGLTPYLEVGVVGGVTIGSFIVDLNQETVGRPTPASEPEAYVQTTLFAGPRVQATLFPVKALRPSFGASVLVLRGRTVLDPTSVPDELAVFSPPTLVAAELFLGGEARLSDRVDFVLQVPIQARLAGEVFTSRRDGLTEVLQPSPPAPAGVLGAGVVAGLQVRLFGAKPKPADRYDELEAIEEE